MKPKADAGNIKLPEMNEGPKQGENNNKKKSKTNEIKQNTTPGIKLIKIN